MKKAARIVAIAGLTAGLAGLLLQFAITVPASMAAGRSFWLSVLYYFSFLTILSNIGAVISHAAQLLPFKALYVFHRRSVTGAITTMMVVVGLVYHFALSILWAPRGLFLICDVILHYISPALMVAWWLITANGKARFKTLMWWLASPAIYLVFVYLRWALVHDVPYPFLDPSLTRQELLRGLVGLCELYVFVAMGVVMTDKMIGWLKRR